MVPDPEGRCARHRCLPCTGVGGRGGTGLGYPQEYSVASGWDPGWGPSVSAFYIVGKTLSLLQEINSQKHKARGAGLFEVSESAVCLLCARQKGNQATGNRKSKRAASLRVSPEGFLGHTFPNSDWGPHPSRPDLSAQGGESPQVLSHSAGANSRWNQISTELSAARLTPDTRFVP